MFGKGPTPSSPTDYMGTYGLPAMSRERPLEEGGESSPPHTPEIISGLMSLTTPMSNYSELSSSSYGDAAVASSPQPSSVGSPGTPVAGPSSPPNFSAPTVEATRSKLIKEGLKLTIQSKRMCLGLSSIRPEFRCPSQQELTPEDEDRRRRRRERNKIAATKCRNKKKERTSRLAVESDSLEADNHALREEIQNLETEKNELLELLRHHLPRCGLPAPLNSCAQAQCSHNCPQVLG